MNQNNCKKPGPAKGVTHWLIKERTEYAAALKVGGVSMESILRTINEMSQSRGWGTISMRQLARSLSEHFSEHERPFSSEEFELFSGLRAAHFATIENAIEKMAMYIRTQKDWKPFEKADAIFKYFNMQCRYAKILGYDYASFQKSRIVNPHSTNQMLLEGHKGLQNASPEAKDILIEYIGELIDKKSQEEHGIIESETEQTISNNETISHKVE